MKIFDKINKNYHLKLPFVAYRKPNKNKVLGKFLKTDDIIFTSSFTESGFVFAPFDDQKNTILFLDKEAESFEEDFIEKVNTSENFSFTENNTSKEKHIALVKRAIKQIENSDLKKIVVSRKEQLQLNKFDIIRIYQKLLDKYKTAFVYVWYHPKIGFWFGATPETLLEIKDNTFKTMSLAGTQPYANKENIVWGNKEIEEQQLVTDFIENQIKDIAKNISIEKAKTVKAGTLLHLKSKVNGELCKSSSFISLIKALHPTPAVCGLPREKAKAFILQNENYTRSFYTGFLGEINKVDDQNSSHLFVNLRCMEVTNNIASIYVGGGITKDSNPLKEWQETISKTATMKNVLQ